MADSPAADITITEALVRHLLRDAGLPYADEPLRLAFAGWDNEMWRVGSSRAVRLPRRDVAVPLIDHEQLVLPRLARLLEPTGVQVPVPLAAMEPSRRFARPWSVVPWFDGGAALTQPRAERTAWAPQLAAALSALHVPADADAPLNPVRGQALATRDDAMRGRLASAHFPAEISAAWDAALDAPVWAQAPVWVHGDLHPGNLVTSDDRLVAMVDFGDVTAGDPAYDLAAAWIVFDVEGRSAFMEASAHVDSATWVRARGWAAAIGVTLSVHSDDRADYARLGAEIIAEVSGDGELASGR